MKKYSVVVRNSQNLEFRKFSQFCFQKFLEINKNQIPKSKSENSQNLDLVFLALGNFQGSLEIS